MSTNVLCKFETVRFVVMCSFGCSKIGCELCSFGC